MVIIITISLKVLLYSATREQEYILETASVSLCFHQFSIRITVPVLSLSPIVLLFPCPADAFPTRTANIPLLLLLAINASTSTSNRFARPRFSGLLPTDSHPVSHSSRRGIARSIYRVRTTSRYTRAGRLVEFQF